MAQKIEHRLNALFHTYNQIRKAEVINDNSSLKKDLIEGLSESCVFLNDPVNDLIIKKEPKDVSEMKFSSGAVKILQNAKILEDFLRAEKKLLQLADLDPLLIENLLEIIRITVRLNNLPGIYWHQSLQYLATTVCNEARKTAESSRHRPLIKRSIVAGGGILIGIVNIFSPPALLPETFVKISTSIGIWLIGEAAGDHVQDWMNK